MPASYLCCKSHTIPKADAPPDTLIITIPEELVLEWGDTTGIQSLHVSVVTGEPKKRP